MKELKISLLEFLEYDCRFTGCSHNEDGECLCDDEDFVWQRLKQVMNNKNGKKIKDVMFSCKHHDIGEDECEFCGEKLKKVVASRETFWGAPATRYDWVCPNNCF